MSNAQIPADRLKNKVLESFENTTRIHCVDIFLRPDGSFGFAEFRRDPEDRGAWQCLGKYGRSAFTSGQAALDAAKGAVLWLDSTLMWRW